ncbi:MAG: hypothetical protein IJS97_04700 [Prevotella sp.]|nr:hypothetical protein [Prevotella sp.]
MKLHLFNPEHDIALAMNLVPFTPPHAARELRANLGFIPALWASDGDVVLVDDVEGAMEQVRHLRPYVADVLFLTLRDLRSFVTESPVFSVDVWGWDKASVHQLKRAGVKDEFLPDEHRLSELREISSRRWASVHLLPELSAWNDGFVGKAWYVESLSDLEERVCKLPKSVLKAPWSCSGRGVRYVSKPEDWPRNRTWAQNVICRQGGIMIEPFYDKIMDFGLEFGINADGSICYQGLSLFKTVNGAYVGSVIATEAEKQKLLSRYVEWSNMQGLISLTTSLLRKNIQGIYQGPLGLDMMVVSIDGRPCVHPCVEMNLRRTMGHVALSLNAKADEPQRLMQITYTDKYRLRVVNTNENVVNNSIY